MIITERTTIAEIVASQPSSARVFWRHGVDVCCGGGKPLSVACEEQGLSLAELVGDIAVAAAAPAEPGVDWASAPLPALIDHLVEAYHDALRQQLPRLETMAWRVRQSHGDRAPDLKAIEELVAGVAAALRRQIRQEHDLVFPAIRALDAGGGDASQVAAAIALLAHQHDEAGALLAELRRVTDGYVPADWACNTLRALYHDLAALEGWMQVLRHLEHDVLVPRALEYVSEADGAGS